MKVERSKIKLSLAPMRVKMRSMSGTRARLAGTKQPMCAMSAMSAVWRR